MAAYSPSELNKRKGHQVRKILDDHQVLRRPVGPKYNYHLTIAATH